MKHFLFFTFLHGFFPAESKTIVAPRVEKQKIALEKILESSDISDFYGLKALFAEDAFCEAKPHQNAQETTINPAASTKTMAKKSLFRKLMYRGCCLAEKAIFFTKAYQWTSTMAKTLHTPPVFMDKTVLASLEKKRNIGENITEVLSCAISQDKIESCTLLSLEKDPVKLMQTIADTTDKTWYYLPITQKPGAVEKITSGVTSLFHGVTSLFGGSKNDPQLHDDGKNLIEKISKLTHKDEIHKTINALLRETKIDSSPKVDIPLGSHSWLERMTLFFKGQSRQDPADLLKDAILKTEKGKPMVLPEDLVLKQGSLWQPSLLTGTIFYVLCPQIFNLNSAAFLLTSQLAANLFNYMNSSPGSILTKTTWTGLLKDDILWAMDKAKSGVQYVMENALPSALVSAGKTGWQAAEWLGAVGKKTWDLAKPNIIPLCFNHYTQKALAKINQYLPLVTPLLLDCWDFKDQRMPLHTLSNLVEYGKRVCSDPSFENTLENA